ncbi:succinate dehydrogenase assembly factor 2, mitochondrial-like [Frieseomelitta varia]|uniref:succinate dehydrogenase assembly factor 2, mitochondrial-like n=1 Tax=Frieseomelitta varia TaxID=561572 RepID=UPI001CB684C7|nr:succinate dehydrogenase assembly factor 2, mitochondrial-like [Frieseomelitta varia]
MNVFIKSLVPAVKPVPLIRCISTTHMNYKDDFQDITHPESREPDIPLYTQRNEENKDIKKARLLYQSRKRGMLENGLLLSTFAKKYLSSFNDKQLHLYDCLINLPTNDWDIFYWATGAKPTPPEFDNEIMDLLKKHIKNEERQARIMQPEL